MPRQYKEPPLVVRRQPMALRMTTVARVANGVEMEDSHPMTVVLCGEVTGYGDCRPSTRNVSRLMGVMLPSRVLWSSIADPATSRPGASSAASTAERKLET